jgi:ribosomal protein L11 methyltransferase
VVVPGEAAEQERARWLELFPQGFEEREARGGLELAGYAERVPPGLAGAAVDEVEPGWEDRWRAFHAGARIGRLWVGPPWENAPPAALPVVIDPGRAFGTGAHATTRLCLELLLDTTPGSLLDVGGGSGVLSIAAAKLGFGPVVAIDHDPQAVEATVANAAANGVEVDARLVDATIDPLPPSDVAVANVALEPVVAVARGLDAAMLLSSGYLACDEPRLPGWRRAERRVSGEWAADRFERE